MNQHDRMTRYYHDPRNWDGLCIVCKHYYQHYLKMGGEFRPADFGHCCQSRKLKGRRAYDTCEQYEKG